jgi:ribonuclease BN (tRNA processing enzyme)
MQPPPHPYTQLVLLGTGTPNAEPDRSGMALAIIVNDTPYLIDFGPGIVRRATAAVARGITALRPANLTHAFLTHLHSDHTAGYPDLILTPWVLGRAQSLTVCGPPGLQAMTDHVLSAYAADIHERRTGLEPANDQGYRVQVREIAPGVCWRDDNVEVTAFPVQHGSWPAFGYKFVTPDRTMVISGDTAPVESVVEHSTGCDVLVHEVYSATGFATRPPKWQRYHAAVHTSTHELAAIAARARPGLLVLVHQLRWGVSEDDLLGEIRARYDGAVVSGHDFDVY